MRYAEPRYTKDVDFWVAIDVQNSESVYRALAEFGAPLEGLTPVDFRNVENFYRMGRPPMRVDIMLSIPGLDFEEAWLSRDCLSIWNLSVPFISKDDLVTSKRASGRPQDLLDLQALTETE